LLFFCRNGGIFVRKRRSDFLSEFVSNQYPIETLKLIIIAALDLVDTFIITLGEESYLNSSTITNYEERLGSFQKNISSKVETMIISNMKTEENMKDFIKKYGIALNSLNSDERDVFICTFIKKKDNLSIQAKLKMHSVQLTMIRKSAIVRFSLKMGLDKFIPLFLNK